MASNDTELISEVRTLTGYAKHEVADSDISQLVEVAKEELQAEYNDPTFTFYQDGTHRADRALFWLTCIGVKVHTGELGSMDFRISDLEASDSNDEYNFWLHRFEVNKRRGAPTSSKGAASTNIERDDRTYEFDVP